DGPDALLGQRLRLFVRKDTGRRARAHAAGVRSGVAVADALVVARRRERDDGLAVDERMQRRLLADEDLLEDHRTRRDRAPRERILRLGAVARDDDTLPRAEAIGLHDHR